MACAASICCCWISRNISFQLGMKPRLKPNVQFNPRSRCCGVHFQRRRLLQAILICVNAPVRQQCGREHISCIPVPDFFHVLSRLSLLAPSVPNQFSGTVSWPWSWSLPPFQLHYPLLFQLPCQSAAFFHCVKKSYHELDVKCLIGGFLRSIKKIQYASQSKAGAQNYASGYDTAATAWRYRRAGAGQQLLQGRLDVLESLKRMAGDAVLPAVRQQVPFGKHHVGNLHRKTVGHAIAHKDDGAPAFPQAADERRFAGGAPVRAGFGRVRERKAPAGGPPPAARSQTGLNRCENAGRRRRASRRGESHNRIRR